MEPTPDTQHFGFTRIARGEQFDKNGFAFSDLDPLMLDQLLFALANHSHDGNERLRGPGDVVPSLTTQATGGTLPSDTTFYYRIAYCDRWGLETEASDEVAITTAPGIAPPEGPVADVETTNGSLGPGLYSYVVTFVTMDGGETTASVPADVRITEGHTNRILLDLATLPAEAEAIRIYRAKPGQTRFYFLQETDAESVYDDGVVPEDQSIAVPVQNTTNSSNSVTVEIPAIPEGVFSWRIYRSTEPGVYDGFNLVHHVIEGSTETSNDLRTSWVDTGDILEQGEPRMVSSTVGGGLPFGEGAGPGSGSDGLRGSRLWSTALPGTVVPREYNRTEFTEGLSPTRMTVFFPEPPQIGPSEVLRIQLVDSQATPQVAELLIGEAQSGEPYYERTWPVATEGFMEAEAGTRAASAPIVNDTTASNGQAVELPEQDAWTEFAWGELELGTYRPFVTLKVEDDQPATPASVRVDIIRTDSDTVIGSSTFVIDRADGWVEMEAQEFNVPGGVPVKFRVTKEDAVVIPYYVDSARFQAHVPSLAPGPISVIVEHDNAPATPTPGSDAQVAVWF